MFAHLTDQTRAVAFYAFTFALALAVALLPLGDAHRRRPAHVAGRHARWPRAPKFDLGPHRSGRAFCGVAPPVPELIIAVARPDGVLKEAEA